jgi:ribosomal-protein-alanine N-acetyltransferase
MIELVDGDGARLGAVGRIMTAAFDPRYGEAWTQAQVNGMLGLPGVWLCLARLDGDMVGFALTRMIVDEAELLLLAVDPARQRRGIGATLLRSAILRAKDRQLDRLHLEVRANNPAINLYQAFGFERVGVRPGYYRGSDNQLYDAFSYSLNLIQTGTIT